MGSNVDALLFPRGVGLGFAIAATVGPISLLVVRRTLAEGRAYGLASGLGVATADGTYCAVAAFGLSAVASLLVEGRRPLALVGLLRARVTPRALRWVNVGSGAVIGTFAIAALVNALTG